MMASALEPFLLSEGKKFEQMIKKEWHDTSKDGKLNCERSIKKENGRKGRIDIFVDEIGHDLVSIIEIKNTNWDMMKEENIRRNARRHIRQLWEYIDSQIKSSAVDICPGIIFSRKPNDIQRLQLLESMFENEGIQIVWHNEPIEELRERMKRKAL